MKILAILVVTLAKLLKEIAYWHLGHIVLVEKFTIVPLLAQMTKPMLADYCPLSTHMTERTMAPSSACAVHEELAERGFVLYY